MSAIIYLKSKGLHSDASTNTVCVRKAREYFNVGKWTLDYPLFHRQTYLILTQPESMFSCLHVFTVSRLLHCRNLSKLKWNSSGILTRSQLIPLGNWILAGIKLDLSFQLGSHRDTLNWDPVELGYFPKDLGSRFKTWIFSQRSGIQTSNWDIFQKVRDRILNWDFSTMGSCQYFNNWDSRGSLYYIDRRLCWQKVLLLHRVVSK